MRADENKDVKIKRGIQNVGVPTLIPIQWPFKRWFTAPGFIVEGIAATYRR